MPLQLRYSWSKPVAFPPFVRAIIWLGIVWAAVHLMGSALVTFDLPGMFLLAQSAGWDNLQAIVRTSAAILSLVGYGMMLIAGVLSLQRRDNWRKQLIWISICLALLNAVEDVSRLVSDVNTARAYSQPWNWFRIMGTLDDLASAMLVPLFLALMLSRPVARAAFQSLKADQAVDDDGPPTHNSNER